MTTITLSWYSLTGFCSTTIYYKESLRVFFVVGLLASMLGFLITTITIWEIINPRENFVTIINFIIVSFTISQISLLLLIQPRIPYIEPLRVIKYYIYFSFSCNAYQTSY